MMSHDREISGVQIASSLLQLPTYYTAHDKFVNVPLYWLRQHVHNAMTVPDFTTGGTFESIPEEDCLLAQSPSQSSPVTRFDDYKWRGKDLEDLCFFEYCMLIRRNPITDSLSSDVAFDPQHPRHRVQLQRIATRPSQVMMERGLVFSISLRLGTL